MDGRLTPGAGAEQIGDVVVAVWQEIDLALHPIIGHRGVAALYSRSLRLTAAAYPWLAAGQCDALDAIDVRALRAALAQQVAGDAAAGGAALFSALRELLASLIGGSLTDQLLRSVWSPSGSPPAQETKK